MQISWLGYSSFRITAGGATLITDPVYPDAKFSIHKQAADIVVSSDELPQLDKAVNGAPMVINQPGEYETKSIFITGVSAEGKTIYRFQIEEMSIGFIGSMALSESKSEMLEVLEGVDILIVPVGGGTVSSAKDAVKLINAIEPRIVIPSHYKIKGATGLDSVDAFIKEYGAPSESIDKYKIVKSQLPQEDTRVVVCEPS